SMSDRVALMRDGRIAQLGAPRDIYLKPTSAFTASFLGHSNMIAGRVEMPGRVQTDLGPIEADTVGFAVQDRVFVIARPQSIAFRPSGSIGPNQFSVRINDLVFLGDEIEVDVSRDDTRLRLIVDSYADLKLGEDVVVELLRERLVIVPFESPQPSPAAASSTRGKKTWGGPSPSLEAAA
ncbi:MAG: hypothetical protein ABI343_07440, partial [Burkholderiaceae bacterium]